MIASIVDSYSDRAGTPARASRPASPRAVSEPNEVASTSPAAVIGGAAWRIAVATVSRGVAPAANPRAACRTSACCSWCRSRRGTGTTRAAAERHAGLSAGVLEDHRWWAWPARRDGVSRVGSDSPVRACCSRGRPGRLPARPRMCPNRGRLYSDRCCCRARASRETHPRGESRCWWCPAGRGRGLEGYGQDKAEKSIRTAEGRYLSTGSRSRARVRSSALGRV